MPARVLLVARVTGIEQVALTVTTGNERAERFYERLGFRAHGREPRGMTYAGAYHALLLMTRSQLK